MARRAPTNSRHCATATSTGESVREARIEVAMIVPVGEFLPDRKIGRERQHKRLQQRAQGTHSGANTCPAVTPLLNDGEKLIGGGLEALLQAGRKVHRRQHFGISAPTVDHALTLSSNLTLRAAEARLRSSPRIASADTVSAPAAVSRPSQGWNRKQMNR